MQKNKKLSVYIYIRIVKMIVFLLLNLVIFFVLLQPLFLWKYSYGKWKNYNEQEKIDILILGNSHANRGIGPNRMVEDFRKTYEEDILVFSYPVDGTHIEQLYFLAYELLKIHTPNLIVLETHTLSPMDEGRRETLAWRTFGILPLNKNKIEAIKYCVFDNHWSYYIPFIKYHTRWKELSKEDFAIFSNTKDWFQEGLTTVADSYPDKICSDPGDNWFTQDTSGINELRELTPSGKECLENLLVLLEEKEVSVIFVSVPYKEQTGLSSIEQIKINNYLKKYYVNNNTVQILDMNRMWKELGFSYGDLYDEGHVNGYGAEKATNCLLQYLKTNYDIDFIKK